VLVVAGQRGRYMVYNHSLMEVKMRTVFSIDLKVDIDSGDEDSAKAILEIITDAAKQLHGQMVLVCKKPPSIAVRTADSIKGQVEVELFQPEIIEPVHVARVARPKR